VSRVLVIDDEPKIVSFITRALTARGFDVDSVPDGARGLELACSGGYAVVVLDLRLPDLDGIEVLRRTLAQRPEQQVIVLSALFDVETKVQCLDLGATDYMTKPFSLLELLARVRRRVRQRVSDGERFLRAGRLTLDLRERTADLGDGQSACLRASFWFFSTWSGDARRSARERSSWAMSGATRSIPVRTSWTCTCDDYERSSAGI
jgi:DNA-binding response OmpR family regulator